MPGYALSDIANKYIENAVKKGSNAISSLSPISCYIIDLLTDTTLRFSLIPDELSETVSASWDTTDIRGRTAPFIGYSGNSARTVSYSLTLHAEYVPNRDILSMVNKLKSLCYPRIEGAIITPPICYVRFGDMVKMRAIVENISVSWEKPIIDNRVFSKAEVSMEFTQFYSSKDLPTHSSMIKDGGNSFNS